MRRFALLVGVLVAGCNEHGRAGIDGDVCGDLGCASGPGVLTITVVDSVTKLPVKGMLMFTTGAQQVPFACSTSTIDPTKDACPSWQTQTLFGGFDIVASVAGYHPGMVHVLVEGPAGCCGLGPPASASLALDPL